MLRRLPLAATFIIVLMLSLTRLAHAGPPYVSDDPEPVPYHTWEVNVGMVFAPESSFTATQLPQIDANYGPLANVQLSLIVPLQYAATPGNNARWRYGETEVGLKWRFIQEGIAVPQVAFYPSIDIPSPQGGVPRTFLPLWVQKTVGKWTAYAGGGIYRMAGASPWTFEGAVLQRATSSVTLVGIEGFRQGSSRSEAAHSGFSLGVTSEASEHTALLASVSRIKGRGADAYQFYAAYQLRFGRSAASPERSTP